MSLPTITVRVAFASNPMVASPTWTDISHDVMSFYISRGRQHELDRMEAGTATIVLKNTSGNYWPSGIYSPNLLPGKAVNIRATYGTTQIYEYYNTGASGTCLTGGVQWSAESFVPAISHTITSVKLPLYKIGSPGTLTVGIRLTDVNGHPTGNDLCSGTTNGDTLTTDTAGEWREITFGVGYGLSVGTKYAIVARAPSGNVVNNVRWKEDITASYTDGNTEQSDDSGATWTGYGNDDLLFEEWGSATYDRYYGFAEAWQPDWRSRAGGLAPIVTLRCADLVKNLSRLKLNNAGYSAELSGTRVTNVLTSLGWLGGTDIAAGQSTMQATGALVNAGAMEHLFTVQQSELGIFFIAGDGHPQFQDRHTRLKSPYTSSQATFGDDVGEQHYHDLEPSYDDTFIYNDVAITRTGGALQQSTDATSITTYGQRSLSRTALLMAQDTEALSQAQFLLSRFKDAALRSRMLTINPERDPGNLWPKALGYDISTRITLRLNQAGINTDYHIEGTQDIYDAARGTYIVKWQLSDADTQQYWAIGVTGLSEIGQTTRVAY